MTQQVEFTDKLVLHIHPQYLDSSIGNYVKSLLESQLEKKWSETHGYVTDVRMLPLKSAGRINAKTGFTEITVEYRAKSCKPIIGEVISAEIALITKLGIHFVSGPFKLFMHEKMLPSSFSFVDDVFRCSRTGVTLQKNAHMNVKIVGTSWTDGEYLLIVSIV